MPRLRLVCLVSGGGRTVLNLLNLLDRSEAGALDAEVVGVLADRQCAAIPRLAARGHEVEIVPWRPGTTPVEYAGRIWPRIEAREPDLVLACGFLRLLLVPEHWRGRIMNIHPALLPKFGGKGMYGDRVHAAVLAAGEKESGCTVHFLDNEYDAGPIILQKRVPVRADDTPEKLAARVFQAECAAYPEAIRLFAEERLRIDKGKVVVT